MNILKSLPYKVLLAEAIGTYLLTGMVLHSIGSGTDFFIKTPFLAALTLGLMVATIGPISGCHINPAVSIALATLNKITWKRAAGYVVAQMLGAFVAGITIINFLPDMMFSQAPMNFDAIAAEMLGAGLLMWGISSIIHKEKDQQLLAPFVIGGSLLLGIAGAVPHSAGILNPAVAIMIVGLDPIYIISPILGAIIAAQLYRYLWK